MAHDPVHAPPLRSSHRLRHLLRPAIHRGLHVLGPRGARHRRRGLLLLVQLGLEALQELLRLVLNRSQVPRRPRVGGVLLLDETRPELVLDAVRAEKSLGRVDLAVAEPPVQIAAAVVGVAVHPREEILPRLGGGPELRVPVPAHVGVDGGRGLGPVARITDPLAVVVLRTVRIAVLLDERDILEAVVDAVRAELWRIGAHCLAGLGIVARPSDPRIGVGNLATLRPLLLHDPEQVFTTLEVVHALGGHAHAAQVAALALNLASALPKISLEFLLLAPNEVRRNRLLGLLLGGVLVAPVPVAVDALIVAHGPIDGLIARSRGAHEAHDASPRCAADCENWLTLIWVPSGVPEGPRQREADHRMRKRQFLRLFTSVCGRQPRTRREAVPFPTRR